MVTARLSPEERARRKREHNRSAARFGAARHAKGMGVTAEVEARWRARLRQSPGSLTAALMGDPLPGESALDRRS